MDSLRCCWFYSGYTSVIGPGNYPQFSTSTFGIPENSLPAVRCLPEEGTQALVLFEDGHYVGQMQVIYSSNPNFAFTNFDNAVSSFIITGGTWEFYSGANYTGSMVTHGQGRYPTPFFLGPIANDDLMSVRLITFGKKGTCDSITMIQEHDGLYTLQCFWKYLTFFVVLLSCCHYSWQWPSTFPPQWSCELSSYNRGIRGSLPM